MKKRVLVISSCAPPLPGRPVTGGGLRTAQLVAAVRAAGEAATLMVERAALGDPEGVPEALLDAAFDVETLAESVASRRPDVIVVEQWALAAHLGALPESVPVVLDLHGSLLLENVYRRGGLDLTLDAGTKIECLRRADRVLVPAWVQVHHFASWMTIAGFDPRRLPLHVLPLALPDPPPPSRRAKKPKLKLVYGGARWPWIDSLAALRASADAVAGLADATLAVHTYEPPRHGMAFDEDLGTWAEVDDALGGREDVGVALETGTEHAEWVAALKTATVALDVWEPNPERTLAATTRTIEFLWAGLPVITVEGAAWSEELVGSGAGWTVPAGDAAALTCLLRELHADPARIAAASRAAVKLVRERHDPVLAARPLTDFLAAPSRSPRAPASLTSAMVAVREAHLDAALQSLKEAHRAEHDRLVAAHRTEVDALRAEHRAEVDGQADRARAEIAALTAAHNGQVARIAEERRAEVERLTAETASELVTRDERHRTEIEAVVADWQQRHETIEARRRKARDKALEERTRLQVELRAEQARTRVLTEEVGRLRSGAAMVVARKLKQALSVGLPGRVEPPGRLGPGARLAKLFAEHAVDREPSA